MRLSQKNLISKLRPFPNDAWPNWTLKEARNQIPENYTNFNDVFFKNSPRKPDWKAFEKIYLIERRRFNKIKIFWGLVAIFVFLTLMFGLGFIAKYSEKHGGLLFTLFTISALTMTYLLVKIRALRIRKSDPIFDDIFKNSELVLPFVARARNKRLPLYIENDHGVFHEVSSKIWTAQNWFLLFSSDEKHRQGISMIGQPPAGPFLVLATDFQELFPVKDDTIVQSPPHTRQCPHLRAIQNNKELMGKFIKAAKRSSKLKKLTEARETWLAASIALHNNWSTWVLYRDKKLSGAIKSEFEGKLIFALTQSNKTSNDSNERLMKFTTPSNRGFNTWVKNLDVVPQESLDKFSKLNK